MNLGIAYDKGWLTGNQLKIIALIAMTIDHIGAYLLPRFIFLRIIGRLAFPIFAFMIAEGCRYTKNRKRYLLTMLALGIVCQIVYFIAFKSIKQCILITFSLSIAFTYVYDYAKQKKDLKSSTLLAVAFGCVFFITKMARPLLFKGTDFGVDYGLLGVLLPCFIYMGKTKDEKLVFTTFGLIALSNSTWWIQWFSLATVPLLALYNGERGRTRMKSLFYIYYPLHLLAIYLIGMILK